MWCSCGWSCAWSCFCVHFFFSSRRRHTRCSRDWSSDVCSSDLVIDLLEPGPQTIIQLHERKRSFGIEVGQKLFSNRAEEALDFSSPFRLIGWRVCDHHADGGGNARQLGAAKLLRVVHIKAHGDATRGNRLSQAIEESMQSLFSIKLSMGDQPAGVVQDGIQAGLHPSATGALNVRPDR